MAKYKNSTCLGALFDKFGQGWLTQSVTLTQGSIKVTVEGRIYELRCPNCVAALKDFKELDLKYCNACKRSFKLSETIAKCYPNGEGDWGFYRSYR